MVWDFLKGEKGGKISLMRMASFLTIISVLSIFVAHNIIAMIKGNSFVSIGTQEAMLLALIMGAKAGQTFAEIKEKKLKDINSTDELPVNKKE